MPRPGKPENTISHRRRDVMVAFVCTKLVKPQKQFRVAMRQGNVKLKASFATIKTKQSSAIRDGVNHQWEVIHSGYST